MRRRKRRKKEKKVERTDWSQREGGRGKQMLRGEMMGERKRARGKWGRKSKWRETKRELEMKR